MERNRQTGKLSTVLAIIIGVLLLLFVVIWAKNYPKISSNMLTPGTKSTDLKINLPIVKTQDLQGSLVANFPEFPVYEGAKVTSSFMGTQNGKTVYGATWEVNRIEGNPPDETSVRTVMHWYEDDPLPETWIFDEPLQQSGNVDNPSKSWLTVSKNGIKVSLTVEAKTPQSPVIVTVLETVQ